MHPWNPNLRRDILGYLAGGMSEEALLKEFPQLEVDDIRACISYTAERERPTFGIPQD